jgi:hypothetical protein
MTDSDEIYRLADVLNLALAGEPSNLVETVISLVAATTIIVNHPQAEWASAARGLSDQVSAILGNKEQVAFIRAGVHHDDGSARKN